MANLDIFTDEPYGRGFLGMQSYGEKARRNLIREQARARIQAGEDPGTVLNEVGPQLYGLDYKPVQTSTEREMRARSILNQPVTTTEPTGRYHVGPSLGETVFQNAAPAGPEPQPVEPPPTRPLQPGGPAWPYEPGANSRVLRPPEGPTGPDEREPAAPPPELPAPREFAEPTFRREPIERREVIAPETETTTRRRTLSEAFNETTDPEGYRALRLYGPGLDQERAFDMLQQGLDSGQPLDKGLVQTLPTMLRGSKSSEWDSLIKAVQASQTGDYSALALDLEAKGDYLGAALARAGNTRLLIQHLANRGKESVANITQTGATARTAMTQDALMQRLEVRAQLERDLQRERSQTSRAVAQIQAAARAGRAAQLGPVLQSFSRQRDSLRKLIQAEQELRSNAALINQPTAPHDARLQQYEAQLQRLDDDEMRVRELAIQSRGAPGGAPAEPGAEPGAGEPGALPPPQRMPLPTPPAPAPGAVPGATPGGEALPQPRSFQETPPAPPAGPPGAAAPQGTGLTPQALQATEQRRKRAQRLNELARARFGRDANRLQPSEAQEIIRLYNQRYPGG
jgi:hypothetical protein